MSDYGIDPLTQICEFNHPIADLVRGFLSSKDDWKTDDWFIGRTKCFFLNEYMASADPLSLETLPIEPNVFAQGNVRLVSIFPHYFRGFRNVEHAIDLSGDLVVIDGRNSSGKTSLAEALEWVLTGQIERRKTGDPKELAEYITNRFKPDNDKTWVECVLDRDGESVTLRRCLVKDYDSKKNSRCETRLLIDDSEVANGSELLVALFQGVPPVLMQHSLRQFVLQNPTDRRKYFERLLNLDGITSLIQKAVVGDAGLAHFAREQGGRMLGKWNTLKSSLPVAKSRLFSDVEDSDRDSVQQNLRTALRSIALQHFSLDEGLGLDEMSERLEESQRRYRESRLPLLETLTPKKKLDPDSMNQLSAFTYENSIKSLEETQVKFEASKNSALQISDAQNVIASTLEGLHELGLIADSELQICPLCEYGDSPTLSRKRIDEVSGWNAAREIQTKAKSEFLAHVSTVRRIIKNLLSLRQGLIPVLLPDTVWPEFDNAELDASLNSLKSVHQLASQGLRPFDKAGAKLIESLKSADEKTDVEAELREFFSVLKPMADHARSYAESFEEFERRLNDDSNTNVTYANRGIWIELYKRSDDFIKDLTWETSKQIAQRELDSIRDFLIHYRQQYLEVRRQEFSQGITDIWSLLREDGYSGFSKIAIPKPRGKGYPVRIEVKALLDDSSTTQEVDALNVLSESQINVIGIAAFITRSKMLGQKCLVFDDPVQSMDDEHFKSFANQLLQHLCGSGFQTIVLTHSDLFARDVSYFHYNRDRYLTLEIVHSRRSGVRVTEGNRRVPERLKLAERVAEEGDLRKAWNYVRLALERLYLVARVAHGSSGFDAHSWANHTAEDMWNCGVEEIFAEFAPDSSKRLKEIVNLAHAGAHDKATSGSTELIRAVNDMRPLLSKLRIGG